jgi:hypothetical protein
VSKLHDCISILAEQRLCQEYGIEVARGFQGGPHKDQWFSSIHFDEGPFIDFWESDYYNTRREAEQAAIEAYERLELEG